MTIPEGFTALQPGKSRAPRTDIPKVHVNTAALYFNGNCNHLPERLSFAYRGNALFIYGDPDGSKRNQYRTAGRASQLSNKPAVRWCLDHWGHDWAVITPYADGWIAKVPE